MGHVAVAKTPFDRAERFESSATISEVLDRVGLEPAPDLRVMLNDVADPDLSHALRDSDLLVIRRVPTDPVTVVATIAIAVEAAGTAAAAAFGLGGVTAAFAGAAFGLGTLGAFLTGIVGFGLAFGASTLLNLAMNALVKPPKSDLPGQAPGPQNSPTLQGTRNRAFPFGPVWRVYGENKINFPFAALPYNRVVGGEQFFYGLYTAGSGLVDIDALSLKVGDTPLAEFNEVRVQIDEGDGVVKDVDLDTGVKTNAVAEMAVFSQDVTELAVGQQWFVDEHPQDWADVVARTTEDNVTQIECDFAWPAGLVTIDRKAILQYLTQNFEARLRLAAKVGVDRGNGVGNPGDWFGPVLVNLGEGGRVTSVGANETAFGWSAVHRGRMFRGFQIIDLAEDQYDLQIRYAFLDDGGFSGNLHTRLGDGQWTQMRSIRADNPINLSNVTRVGVEIRAQDQVQGNLDTLNGVVSSKIRAWNGASWDAPAVTRNPAWIYADMLQGVSSPKPVADTRLDLATLLTFSTFCEPTPGTYDWAYDAVHDFESTVQEVVNNCLNAARATYTSRDGKHSLIIDTTRSSPVQMFTPRNSRDAVTNLKYLDPVHALRVSFINRDENWERDERIVYATGFTEMNATEFEDLTLVGVTDPDQVFKLGDYHNRQIRLRPNIYQRTVDWEYLIAERGDRVLISDDVIQGDVEWALITQVNVDGMSNVTSFVLEAPVNYLPAQSHGVTIRTVDAGGVITTRTYAVDNPAGAEIVKSATVTPSSPIAPGDDVAVGQLVAFGLVAGQTIDCIVLAVKPQGEMSAQLVMTEYAPTTFDHGTPPAFTSNLQVSIFSKPPGLSLGEVVQDLQAIRVPFTINERLPGQVNAVEVQAQYRLEGTDTWIPVPPVAPTAGEVAFHGLAPQLPFEFRLRSRAEATWSDWAVVEAEFTGAPPTSDRYRVSALRLAHGGNTTVFSGRSAIFTWRLAYADERDPFSAQQEVLIQEPGSYNYLVQVLDVERAVLREEEVRDNTYTYDLERQTIDPGPLRREFIVRVAFKDSFGTVGEFQEIRVENPAPQLLTVNLQDTIAGLGVAYAEPTDLDFEGIIVWAHTSMGFTPGPTFEISRGRGTPINIPLADGTWYVRAAAYDVFALDPRTGEIDLTLLNITAEQSIELTAAGLIDTEDIAPSAVTELVDANVDNFFYLWAGQFNQVVVSAAITPATLDPIIIWVNAVAEPDGTRLENGTMVVVLDELDEGLTIRNFEVPITPVQRGLPPQNGWIGQTSLVARFDPVNFNQKEFRLRLDSLNADFATVTVDATMVVTQVKR